MDAHSAHLFSTAHKGNPASYVWFTLQGHFFRNAFSQIPLFLGTPQPSVMGIEGSLCGRVHPAVTVVVGNWKTTESKSASWRKSYVSGNGLGYFGYDFRAFLSYFVSGMRSPFGMPSGW